MTDGLPRAKVLLYPGSVFKGVCLKRLLAADEGVWKCYTLSSVFDEFILNLSVIQSSFQLTVITLKQSWSASDHNGRKRWNESVGTQTRSCNKRQELENECKKVTIGWEIAKANCFWHSFNRKLLFQLFWKVSFNICCCMRVYRYNKCFWCKHFGANKFQAATNKLPKGGSRGSLSLWRTRFQLSCETFVSTHFICLVTESDKLTTS